MNVKILKQSDRKIEMIVEDIDAALANALRRSMLSEIPVLAIEHVDFVDNSSGLYDEVVAHRLGLIPLEFPLNFNIKSECSCNKRGCSNCQANFYVEKEGPCVIKAGDLVSNNKDVKPIDPEIPIVELFANQAMKFEAIAEMGFGKDHIKWQAAVVGYRNVPSIRIVGKEDLDQAFKVCPRDVFAKKGDGIGIAKSMNCDLCMRCTEVCGSINVSADDTKFIFTIESVCGLTAEQVFNKALDVLEKKAKDFIKAVKSEV